MLATLVITRATCATQVESKEIHTDHYDFYIEGPRADELGALVEPLYARLKEFFGKEPNERLLVKVFASRDTFNDTANRDHVEPIRRSFFSPTNHVCYVLREDGERHTILHECTHQFHFLAATNNQGTRSWYYTEGLAEHFSVHRWNGERAILEAVPQIDNHDVGELAMDDFLNRHARSLAQLARDDDEFTDKSSTAIGYAGGWGLVGFLYERHREIFDVWHTALDNGASPQAAWDRASHGIDSSKLNDEYEQWIHDAEAPWHVAAGSWASPNLKRIEGKADSDAIATAYLKKPVDSLSAVVQIGETEDKVAAGLVVGRVGDHTYHLVEVLPDGQVRVRTLIRGKAALGWVVENVRVRDPKQFTIAFKRQDNVALITIDDAPVTQLPVGPEGKSGLVVSGGAATFAPTAQ